MKRILALVSIVIMVCLLLIPSGTVFADQTYHSERLPVHSLVRSVYPLRNGVVVNIHTNGPVNYAVEEYILNGAKPDTTYHLVRVFSDSLFPFAGLPLYTGFDLQTDKNGNGNCNLKALPAEIEPIIDMGFTTLHVTFVFIEGGNLSEIYPGVFAVFGGTQAYATEETQIFLDVWK